MGLFDEIVDIFTDGDSALPPDLYVQDLEKVTFTIDGESKDFVGGSFGGVPFLWRLTH